MERTTSVSERCCSTVLVLVMIQLLGVAAGSNCSYSAHSHTTFLSNENVIECVDAEGRESCQQRCTGDYLCTGFGLYTNSSKKGRCCTKSNNNNPTDWHDGTSYTKDEMNCTLNPRPLAVKHSTMFAGNSSFPYNKGAVDI